LAAGLCPDPLGVLKRSPRLPAAIRGPTSKGRGGKGKGGGWKGRGTPPADQQKLVEFFAVFCGKNTN